MEKVVTIFKYILFVLLNVFFWVSVYFFYTYFLGYGSSNVEYVNKFSAYLMPVTIAISYFVILFLIPNYLLKKQYFLFALYSFYTFIVSFTAILISIFYGLIFSSYLKDLDTLALTKSLPLIILGVYFIVVVSTTISLLFYSYRSNIKNEDLKNKFLETQLQLKEQELKFLKMQIHPHFLFNALNTIYGFALTKKEETPEMILKLSDLLDYILYQIDKPTVILNEELKHIKNYIELEKIRFYDTLQVSLDIEDVEEEIKIAPMLLIPLVENAFKHGTMIEEFLKVNIIAKKVENDFIFHIVNSCSDNSLSSKGIGLENIRKRLEMLYPNQHSLEIKKENNQFEVILKIALKE